MLSSTSSSLPCSSWRPASRDRAVWASADSAATSGCQPNCGHALIASVYLVGTNTRRVRRALVALFGSAVDKDVVSRTWRKVRSDWDAWNARPRANEPIMRLILDGRVVRVRLDEKRPHDQRHRTPARGIQTTHQTADRAAFGRHGGHAILGADGVWGKSQCERSADGRPLAHLSLNRSTSPLKPIVLTDRRPFGKIPTLSATAPRSPGSSSMFAMLVQTDLGARQIVAGGFSDQKKLDIEEYRNVRHQDCYHCS